MKSTLLILSLLFSLSSFAQTISELPMTDIQVLAKYIANDFGSDATFESALDDDEVSGQTFSYKGEALKMLIVYSGDTAHGPIYSIKTLKIVGNMSDGDISIRGEYVDVDVLENEIKLVKFTINDFFCGEMDPFVVGDVCLLMIENSEKKLGIVLDFDRTQETIENPDGMKGEKILVRYDLLSNIQDWDVIAELKQFNSKYYYMMTNADVDELIEL